MTEILSRINHVVVAPVALAVSGVGRDPGLAEGELVLALPIEVAIGHVEVEKINACHSEVAHKKASI